MRLVEMQPWHLISVAMNLRDEDREEFGAVYADTDPQKWACRRALALGMALAVIGSDGVPVCCFGYYEEHEGQATAWMVATPRWKCSVKTIARQFRQIVKSGVFVTIAAYARPSRPEARKFMEWLGFEYRGSLPHYCRNGEPMEFFSIVCKEGV